MWNLAIDFGTSNTTGATWADGVVAPLEVNRDRRVPSVVLLSADGTWVVGREADNQAVVVPERVERAPKRRIGKGHSLLLGGQAVPITSAVAALLGPHTQAGRARHAGDPAHIVMTHPAKWGPERIDVLRMAADEAGFARVEFCPEPVAAAHYVDDPLEIGQHVAVYDLGGGTFDTCVVRRTDTSFKVVGLPGGTDRIGGEDFDHRMYQLLGQAVAREDASAWEAMTTSDDRVERAAADLLTQARDAKEQLSRNPRTSVYVGSIERDITVTRDEFEAMISADVDRTVSEMERTIRDVGLTEAEVAKVYLVGGSSRLPIVQERMGARFGDRVSTWDDPKGVVVLGAAKFSGTLPMPDAAGVQVPNDPYPQPVPSGPIMVTPPPPRTGQIPEVPPATPVSGYPEQGAIADPAAGYAAPSPVGTPPVDPVPTYQAGPPFTATPPPVTAPPPAYTPAPAQPAPAWTPGPAGQPGYPAAKPPGSDQVTYAWIGAGLSLVCCLPAPAAGMYFANEAKKQGHPQAQTAFIVSVAGLVLNILLWGLWFLSILLSAGSTS